MTSQTFEYYDWNKTLSYDADVTMVVGERGIGKTYGLRKQFVNDYINHKWRFLDLCRHKTQVPSHALDYFAKLIEKDEFPDYVFKTDGRRAYIAKKPKSESDKPFFEVFGYFGALSQAQDIKNNSSNYSRVRRILLDEAIIDKRIDKIHRYFNNEYGMLTSIVESVARQRPGEESVEPRIYLCGNAADLLNPYFARYKIYNPMRGYSWHDNKNMLLHYTDNEEYGEAKKVDTVAGRMANGSIDEKVSSNNEFVIASNDYVEKKPKHAKFYFGLVYNNEKFGVWIDEVNGYYYINSKIPNNASPIYALTTEDNRVNYITAGRANKMLKGFMDFHYYDMLRYEDSVIKTRFTQVLELFGIT